MKAEEKFQLVSKAGKTWMMGPERILEIRELLEFWDVNQWQPIEMLGNTTDRVLLLRRGQCSIGDPDGTGMIWDLLSRCWESNHTHWRPLPKGPQ